MNQYTTEVNELAGQVALVTGAGRGIGRAIAITLAKAGAKLVLVDLRACRSKLEVTAKRVRAQGSQAVVIPADITRVNEIFSVVDQAISTWGSLNILVNNAGCNVLKPALDVTEDEWDYIQAVNVRGAFFCAQAVARHMVAAEVSGSIINIASQHGIVANMDRAPYCTSKAALIHLTKSLALEWSKYNIRVNAVAPTFVETQANKHDLNAEPVRTHLLSRIPLGRFACPEEVAEAVCYLCKPQSSLITGHTLVLDGGWTLP